MSTQPLTLAELLQPAGLSEPWHGVNLLEALLHKPRPDVDIDRFTSGIGLVSLDATPSDPLPVLF